MSEIHSPKKIFKFNPKYNFDNYEISKEYYDKLSNTFRYISNMTWKKLEYKYLDDDQMIEIHRWLGNQCYLEYRSFECEDITDLITLDLFEDSEDTYENLLIFNSNNSSNDLINQLIIGNDYFGSGFVLTPEFEWRLYDGCNYIDIEQDDISLEEIEHIRMDQPYNYDINKVIDCFREFISLE